MLWISGATTLIIDTFTLGQIKCAEVVFYILVERLIRLGRLSGSESKNFHKPIQTLLQNMQIYDELKCRDPRDRIYALLAISSDTTQLSIKPDYSASISEVFRMVTISILRQASDLQVLRFACYWDNTTESAHPSWVLNGSRDQHLTATMGFHSEGYTPLPRQLFSAPHLPLDSFTLILKGRILDAYLSPHHQHIGLYPTISIIG
jgi:hypothetical protein